MTRGSGDLVVVADVHLGRDDPDLDAFVAFLRARADDTAVLVLLGDIFSLWLGRAKFTEAHHRAVLDACAGLRDRGVRVVFIEGNREYAVQGWKGQAFDSVAESIAEEPWAGRRWYLAHGDLLNREDRINTAFRAIVRSPVVLGAFGLLPASLGLRAAGWLERTLRHRNLRHKTSLPDDRLAAYAEWFSARGFDAGVIGHVHVERRVDLPVDGGAPRSLWVLPDWRTARRYLRVPREGEPRFEAWGPERPDPPAVVEVEETAERVRVVLARRAEATIGELAAVSSGHGPEVRRGRVTACEPGPSARLTLALEPGPPVQVGDRVILRHEEGP